MGYADIARDEEKFRFKKHFTFLYSKLVRYSSFIQNLCCIQSHIVMIKRFSVMRSKFCFHVYVSRSRSPVQFSMSRSASQGHPFEIFNEPFSVHSYPFGIFNEPFEIFHQPFGVQRYPFGIFNEPFDWSWPPVRNFYPAVRRSKLPVRNFQWAVRRSVSPVSNGLTTRFLPVR